MRCVGPTPRSGARRHYVEIESGAEKFARWQSRHVPANARSQLGSLDDSEVVLILVSFSTASPSSVSNVNRSVVIPPFWRN